MPHFEKTVSVPFTPAQMRVLVADVEQYGLFVPFCQSCHIIRIEQEASPFIPRIMLVKMIVSYKNLKESFVSRVRVDEDQQSVVADFVSGPFHSLVNRWTFEPHCLGQGCLVHFELDYKMKFGPFDLLARQVFDRMFAKFSDAFIQRAYALYGHDRGHLE